MAPRRDPLNSDDILRRLAQSGGGGGSSSSSGGGKQKEQEPSVWFAPGKKSVPLRPKTSKKPSDSFFKGGARPRNFIEAYEPAYPQAPVVGPDDKRALSAAQGEFYKWDAAGRKKWADHLVAVGYLDPEDADSYAEQLKAWNEVIGEAANFTGAGKKIDPWRVAAIIAGTDNEGAGGGRAGGGKTKAGRERGFTGSRTTTSSNVDLTDPSTAKALVESVLSKQLGRAPNAAEITAFTATLNSAEQANPLLTTTTTQYDDGQALGQQSSTTGGLSAPAREQLLTDKSQSMPEYGAYQASSFYFPLLAQALGATTGG